MVFRTERERVARVAPPNGRDSQSVQLAEKANVVAGGDVLVLEGTQGWSPKKMVAIPGVPGSRSDSFGCRKGLRRRQKDGELAGSNWEIWDVVEWLSWCHVTRPVP